ncbi:YesL family protein [Micromonospora sp. WMMD1082]|uniref:YesL family protein n=1 Tax=Micromonospora sp. WMMD1082 TaxID=3016104 RepID=UPI002416241A|nr:YesL family protein [Micromonospora sp. WMMD1082]MDG4798100.1 YesL family protein [Micromonospora sp. WMMD1082]
MSTAARREFGAGPLSRIAALVYTLLVVELLLLVCAAPSLVALFALERHVSNLPLVAACTVPLGPALSAALYALYQQRLDLTELHPWRLFWRGYRANLAGSLLVWVPTLLWLTIIAVNLANLSAAGLSGWWAAPLVLVGAGVSVIGVNALVITSLFTFRLRDVVRLAAYFVLRTPVVALGVALLLVAATLLTHATSEAALAALGSVLALALVRGGEPMIAIIREEFTRDRGE